MEDQKPRSPGAADAAFRGSLDETPLPQILRQIFLDQLHGTLTLSRGEESRRLFFEKGELKTATSSRETQRIGSFLKRRGRITDEDLGRALTEIARQGRSRLGRVLVERGLMTRSVIDAEMKRLVEEIVLSAFEWDSGEYRFEPATAVLDPDVALSLSTAAIIVEGIRRQPEAPVFRDRLGAGNRVPRLAHDPMSRYQYLPLTPQEAYVLSRIDGLVDVDSLLSIAGGSRAATAKTLYALLSCGLVEWKTDGGARRETVGTVATLNVELSSEPPRSTPGHEELVRKTWRRIDWLSHYELLGVARDASAEEVRRAHLDQSRLFHPDLRHRPDLAGLEKELTAVFERLKVAHDTLSDPEKRAEYDRGLDETPAAVFTPEATAEPEAGRQLAAKNFERALELIDAKDYYPAVELLREAVRFAPDRADYRFRLGEVELKNANWIDRGLENMKEATRLAPSRGEFLSQTARALASHGRKREAEPFARRAAEIDPSPESSALLEEIAGPAAAAETEQEPKKRESRPAGFFSRLFGRKSG